jgi:hypothetical protein
MRNTGLILETPNEKDHIIGGITVGGLGVEKPQPLLIFPNGHGWLDTIGAERGEVQANDHYDTYLCTIFGVAGALSDYMKKVYNYDLDISECIQGVMAGVTPGVGGTIRNSLESFRIKGWVDEGYRKFTSSTTQGQCFAVVTETIKKVAADKLKDWDVYWDLIDSSDNVPHAKIIDALKYSEVVVAGYAWASYYGGQGVYDSYSNIANHCFRIGDGGNITQSVKDKFTGRGFDINWNDADLIAIDSYRYDWSKDEPDHTEYNDFLKPLAKTFRIYSAYRIYAKPKVSLIDQSLIGKIKSMFKKISRDIHGSLWFIKDGKKQQITNWKAFAGAVIDEVGVVQNGLKDEQLNLYPDYKFFGD